MWSMNIPKKSKSVDIIYMLLKLLHNVFIRNFETWFMIDIKVGRYIDKYTYVYISTW